MVVRSSIVALVLGLTALLGMGCDKTPPPKEGPAEPAGAGSAPPSSTGPVRISGSSALQPLVNAAKEKFEAANKGASIEVSAGGSKKGLVDVASGAVQIGDSDLFAAPNQQDLVDHKVAAVAFAAMANKGSYNAKITSVGFEELGKVFSGEIKSWKDLGGDAQPIVLINRAPASGTRTVFATVVLGGDTFAPSQTEDDSEALVAKLRQTPGAISYLALSFKDDALLTLSIKLGPETIEPTPGNVASGKYPIWGYEHMYTKGEPTGTTKQFLAFILSDDFQTHTLPTVKGFLPITLLKIKQDRD
jgi:phosphate transport system substrate-binding protein